MAWDTVQRRSEWEQRIASTRAGVLATGGNRVFLSTVNTFKVYRGDIGRKVWSSDIQSGAVGGAVSYEIDGEQFISTISGKPSTMPSPPMIPPSPRWAMPSSKSSPPN